MQLMSSEGLGYRVRKVGTTIGTRACTHPDAVPLAMQWFHGAAAGLGYSDNRSIDAPS